MDKGYRFNASWGFLIYTFLTLVALAILGILQNGLKIEALALGTIIAFAVIVYSYFTRAKTYLEILEDQRTLINAGQKAFQKEVMDIYDIKNVERIPAFKLRSWGSDMVIYAKEDDGKLHHSRVRESNYSIDTIKDFLSSLKRVNPSIKLNKQYQSLVEGSFKDEESFKQYPAEETAQEVEKRLGITTDDT